MTEAATSTRPSSPYYTEPSWLRVGDLDVAYRRKGSGDPVVFLHGAGATQMWLPFYERLSENVDLIAPEHPGFGDTEFPDWLDGFDDLVLHYRDLFDLLELDRIHLVGYSLGGWISGHLAIFYPERLKSLTLITPAGMHVPEAPMVDLFAMPPEGIPDLLFNGNFLPYTDFLPNPAILGRDRPRLRRDGNACQADLVASLRARSSSGGCRGFACLRSSSAPRTTG